MAGSVSRQGTTWQFVVDLGLDGNGRRRQHRRRGFATKKDAERAMVEAQALALTGELASPGRLTLEDFVARWLDAVQVSLAPAAFTNYRQAMRYYVLPRLGRVQLSALNPLTISAMYAELLRAGGRNGKALSPSSVRIVHAVLRKCLNDAVRWGLLGVNPALRATVPRRQRPQLRLWSPEEASAFVAGIRGDRLEACWLLALTGGLRRGELAGLHWAEVDLDRALLRITCQRTTDSEYQVITKEPKASSRRSVALGAYAVGVLRRHRTAQVAERLAAGALWEDSGLVFVDELGRGLHPQRLTDLFQARTAELELPRQRLHDLRHAAATLALVAGVHPKVVQERLGHSTIGMTLDIYSHVLVGMQHDAAGLVEGLLLPTPPAAVVDARRGEVT